jgi:hypothetical protein
MRLVRSVNRPQHPDKHRSERPILLAIDQELGEGASRGQVAEACREQLQPSSLVRVSNRRVGGLMVARVVG